jgi:ribosomal protein S27E
MTPMGSNGPSRREGEGHFWKAVDGTIMFASCLIFAGCALAMIAVSWPLLLVAAVVVSPGFLFFYIRSRLRARDGRKRQPELAAQTVVRPSQERIGEGRVAEVPSARYEPPPVASDPEPRIPLYSTVCLGCRERNIVFREDALTCFGCGSGLIGAKEAIVERPDGTYEIGGFISPLHGRS